MLSFSWCKMCALVLLGGNVVVPLAGQQACQVRCADAISASGVNHPNAAAVCRAPPCGCAFAQHALQHRSGGRRWTKKQCTAERPVDACHCKQIGHALCDVSEPSMACKCQVGRRTCCRMRSCRFARIASSAVRLDRRCGRVSRAGATVGTGISVVPRRLSMNDCCARLLPPAQPPTAALLCDKRSIIAAVRRATASATVCLSLLSLAAVCFFAKL